MLSICTKCIRPRPCDNPECGILTPAGQPIWWVVSIGDNNLRGHFCAACESAITLAPADLIDSARDLDDLFTRLRQHATEERRACRDDDASADRRRHPNEL